MSTESLTPVEVISTPKDGADIAISDGDILPASDYLDMGTDDDAPEPDYDREIQHQEALDAIEAIRREPKPAVSLGVRALWLTYAAQKLSEINKLGGFIKSNKARSNEAVADKKDKLVKEADAAIIRGYGLDVMVKHGYITELDATDQLTGVRHAIRGQNKKERKAFLESIKRRP